MHDLPPAPGFRRPVNSPSRLATAGMPVDASGMPLNVEQAVASQIVALRRLWRRMAPPAAELTYSSLRRSGLPAGEQLGFGYEKDRRS